MHRVFKSKIAILPGSPLQPAAAATGRAWGAHSGMGQSPLLVQQHLRYNAAAANATQAASRTEWGLRDLPGWQPARLYLPLAANRHGATPWGGMASEAMIKLFMHALLLPGQPFKATGWQPDSKTMPKQCQTAAPRCCTQPSDSSSPGSIVFEFPSAAVVISTRTQTCSCHNARGCEVAACSILADGMAESKDVPASSEICQHAPESRRAVAPRTRYPHWGF